MVGVAGSGAAGTAPRILIVDDDEHIVDFLGMAFQDEGYAVSTAPNGAVALDRAREQPPNVIILDLWMPIMDGWQFLEEYRRRPGPHAAVIALTAAQYDPTRTTAIETDGFLTKPFSLDALLEMVNLYTGGAR